MDLRRFGKWRTAGRVSWLPDQVGENVQMCKLNISVFRRNWWITADQRVVINKSALETHRSQTLWRRKKIPHMHADSSVSLENSLPIKGRSFDTVILCFYALFKAQRCCDDLALKPRQMWYLRWWKGSKHVNFSQSVGGRGNYCPSVDVGNYSRSKKHADLCLWREQVYSYKYRISKHGQEIRFQTLREQQAGELGCFISFCLSETAVHHHHLHRRHQAWPHSSATIIRLAELTITPRSRHRKQNNPINSHSTAPKVRLTWNDCDFPLKLKLPKLATSEATLSFRLDFTWKRRENELWQDKKLRKSLPSGIIDNVGCPWRCPSAWFPAQGVI